MVTEAMCSTCKQVKPADEFHKNKQRKCGLTTRCKDCVNSYCKQYYQENKEKVRTRQNTKYKTDEAFRERLKQYGVVYSTSENRRKVVRERDRQRRANDPVYRNKVNERSRKRRAGNKKYLCLNAERQHKRRAMQRNNGHYKVSVSEIAQIKQTPCAFCGSTHQITIDHIIPITRGGRHSIGNLQALCMLCNASKNNKLMIEWKQQKRKDAMK